MLRRAFFEPVGCFEQLFHILFVESQAFLKCFHCRLVRLESDPAPVRHEHAVAITWIVPDPVTILTREAVVLWPEGLLVPFHDVVNVAGSELLTALDAPKQSSVELRVDFRQPVVKIAALFGRRHCAVGQVDQRGRNHRIDRLFLSHRAIHF